MVFEILIFKRNPSLSVDFLPIPQFSFLTFLTNMWTNLLGGGIKESLWAVFHRIKAENENFAFFFLFNQLLKFCFGFVHIEESAERIWIHCFESRNMDYIYSLLACFQGSLPFWGI